MEIKKKISYPVSIREVNDHLRISDDDDENYLKRLIKVATQEAESQLGMSLAYTKNTFIIDDFSSDEVEIFEGNYKSISSIQNDASANVAYDKVVVSGHKFIVELSNYVTTGPLTIVFYTGFNSDDEDNDFMESAKQYILIKIADLYEPLRSSFSFGALKANDHIGHLLDGKRGYY